MTARRSRGDGGLSWDDTRQRWIASVTVGYTADGKRIWRRASGRTKTEARTITETVYRKQLRPIIDDGATVMDRVFPARNDSYSVGYSPRPPTPKRPGPELR